MNSYLMQFYEINICRAMIFSFYIVFKMQDDDKNWQWNKRKIGSVIARSQIILLWTVCNGLLPTVWDPSLWIIRDILSQFDSPWSGCVAFISRPMIFFANSVLDDGTEYNWQQSCSSTFENTHHVSLVWLPICIIWDLI